MSAVSNGPSRVGLNPYTLGLAQANVSVRVAVTEEAAKRITRIELARAVVTVNDEAGLQAHRR